MHGRVSENKTVQSSSLSLEISLLLQQDQNREGYQARAGGGAKQVKSVFAFSGWGQWVSPSLGRHPGTYNGPEHTRPKVKKLKE